MSASSQVFLVLCVARTFVRFHNKLRNLCKCRDLVGKFDYGLSSVDPRVKIVCLFRGVWDAY